eukprot:m.74403 g.74403  ORF g.74403 m.74403 type:complete len:78 (+) comp14359_c0_seq4:696-929(+)
METQPSLEKKIQDMWLTKPIGCKEACHTVAVLPKQAQDGDLDHRNILLLAAFFRLLFAKTAAYKCSLDHRDDGSVVR